MTDVVTLASGEARVDVAPAIGGAIVAFRWRGHDVLRPTPAQALAQGDVRQLASFPLVPYSNRVTQGRLHFAGTSFELGCNVPDIPHAIHGVGFQRPWTATATHADRVELALDYRPEDDALRGWPFAFRATQSIALREMPGAAALQMSLAIASADVRPFPFGLGWHPYFPRSGASVLGFAADGVWQTGPTLLPTRHAPVPAAWSFASPRAIGATTLDNVFTGVTGAVLLDDPNRGLRVSVVGDSATPFLVVFVPPGRDFLAVEPVTHMTDAFNRHARGESGTGTRMLPPGGAFSCTMRIVAQSLPQKAA